MLGPVSGGRSPSCARSVTARSPGQLPAGGDGPRRAKPPQLLRARAGASPAQPLLSRANEYEDLHRDRRTVIVRVGLRVGLRPAAPQAWGARPSAPSSPRRSCRPRRTPPIPCRRSPHRASSFRSCRSSGTCRSSRPCRRRPWPRDPGGNPTMWRGDGGDERGGAGRGGASLRLRPPRRMS